MKVATAIEILENSGARLSANEVLVYNYGIHMTHLRRSLGKAQLPLLLITALAAANYLAPSPSAQATVTITGIEANHSAVKVFFRPVPGARDYRVYDTATPNSVKYAGLTHLTASPACPGTYCLHHFVTTDGVTPVFPFQIASGATGGPQVLDIPAPQIDWNNVGNGGPHTLIVEAVDRLGPVPQGNLYIGLQNVPLVNPLPAGAMLGSNKGPTSDGKISTNGQGPYSNNPVVIARSAPFVVQANVGYKAIPSKASSTQTFFDTFENAEGTTIQQIYRNDTSVDAFGNLGTLRYRMNAGTPKAWEIEFRRSDNINSMPMVSSDHFMDILFDGASPNTSAPTHTIWGSMSMTPTQTLDMSSGKMLHMTMEVDGHQTLRRWLAFDVAPASDPLQGWHPEGEAINNTNRGVFLEVKDGSCTLDIYDGPAAPSMPSGTAGGPAHGSRLWGQAGAVGGAPIMCGWDQMYIQKNQSKNGFGLDDKSRYDFFLTQTHAALFQDGQLIVQSDIPAGSFSWANVPLRGYYSHYLYHSDQDWQDQTNVQNSGQTMCFPLNAFWFNHVQNGMAASQTVCNTAYPPGFGFRFSDERHWDNMGFEVFPASEVPGTNFASLASLVQPPPRLPVGSAPPTPPATPTGLRIISLLWSSTLERLF